MIGNREVAFRLILSIVLSGIIGLDRESTKKPAGLRTHILVSLGSTLIMLLSFFGGELSASNRLSAKVISGIGFLGAGTILISERGEVTGLTTAASLWVVAAIGLSVGAGFYFGALLTTVLMFFILMFFGNIESKFLMDRGRNVYISLRLKTSDFEAGQVFDVLDSLGKDALNFKSYRSDDELVVRMSLRVKNLEEKNKILKELSKIEGIIEVSDRD